MTMRSMVIIAAIYGMTGVIFGAYGAHALREKIGPERLASFETGVRYQLIHAVALLVVALLAGRASSPWLGCTACLFVAGIFLFSGSIYILSVRDLVGLNSWRWLGPITPLGGLCLIGGWTTLLIWALRNRM